MIQWVWVTEILVWSFRQVLFHYHISKFLLPNTVIDNMIVRYGNYVLCCRGTKTLSKKNLRQDEQDRPDVVFYHVNPVNPV
jgi:hypothetical protein